MPTYVALLRGINVGRARKVPMRDLRALFEKLGHTDVRTYIQSGNVVFTAKTRTPARIRATIEEGIEETFGFEVTVLLRTAAELKAVLKQNPYGEAGYITFLEAKADVKKVEAIDRAPLAPDEFTVHGSDVFVHCPNGYGNTKINNNFFERKLATRGTSRNWRTVTKLYEWASGQA